MKREELTKIGLTEDQVTEVLNLVHAEVDPIKADLTKASEDLKVMTTTKETLEGTIKNLEAELDNHKGEDVVNLKKEIEDLNKKIKEQADDYAREKADRDFSDMVDKAIADAKGRNAKAVKSLLDIEALKGSKNQKEDLVAQLKALAENEDSSFLFGNDTVKTIDAVGSMKGGTPSTLTGVEKAFLEKNPNIKL